MPSRAKDASTKRVQALDKQYEAARRQLERTQAQQANAEKRLQEASDELAELADRVARGYMSLLHRELTEETITERARLRNAIASAAGMLNAGMSALGRTVRLGNRA